MTKQRNWVAKHARSYNRSAIHRDRKKDAKRGVEKHKARSLDRAFSLTDFVEGWIEQRGAHSSDPTQRTGCRWADLRARFQRNIRFKSLSMRNR